MFGVLIMEDIRPPKTTSEADKLIKILNLKITLIDKTKDKKEKQSKLFELITELNNLDKRMKFLNINDVIINKISSFRKLTRL